MPQQRDYLRKRLTRNCLAWSFVVFVCAVGMTYYDLRILIPSAVEMRSANGSGHGISFGDDFYILWLSTRESLLSHRDPYSLDTTRLIQVGTFGRIQDAPRPGFIADPRAFAYPAFAELLFWPLALMPFAEIRILLVMILPTLTALSVVLWLRALRRYVTASTLAAFLVLTLSNYAVLEAVFAEQVGLFVAFFLAASLALLVADRLFLSGMLLALTTSKPQMMLLAGAYLMLWSLVQWRQRWKFAAGFCLVTSLLGATSMLIWPGWIAEWLRALETYRQYAPPPLLSYLLGNRMGPHFGPVLIFALLVGALALMWKMRNLSPASPQFVLTVCFLLAATTISLLPGQAVYDHVILMPGILLIALAWRDFATSVPFRVILIVSAIALFWQWISAPIVVALRLTLSPQLFASLALTLPIRTASSIPFGVCALLGMMLRQQCRTQAARQASA